ncbi:hypothetical protein BMAPRL20_0612 [Burkholderia mallei PRL-20]|nr:hypothetical protein BMAPRL20_0612 [Burkholderia mallei PRL-20]
MFEAIDRVCRGRDIASGIRRRSARTGGKVPAPLDMRDARRARHVRHVAADRAIPDIERRGAVSARLAASAGAAARPHVGHGDRAHLRRGHASGQGLDAYCRIGAALRRSSAGRSCARPPPVAVPARRDRHIRNRHVRNPGRCAADCPDRGAGATFRLDIVNLRG